MELPDTLSAHPGLDTFPALVVATSVRGVRRVEGRGRVWTGSGTCFRIASLTKAFTSTALVLELRERGIGLDTPAIELLPRLASGWRAARDLSVEQVLGQVSGLRESVSGPVLAALGPGSGAIEEAARLVVAAGNDREPGHRWSYYNGNYFLAGALLEAVTGVSYEAAVRQRLLGPWGLTRTAFEEPAGAVNGWDGERELPESGYPRSRRPSGGLWSSAADLLTLGERVLADPPLVQALAEPRTRVDDPMTYGLGWAVGPSGQLFLNGRLPGYRAAMLLVPDAGLVGVALAAQQQALPVLARILSDVQHPLTGDDLAAAIDDFAA